MNILTVDDFFPDVVSHGFFGRQGGVSTGLYQSLNCSPQSKDDPQNVAENRARVLKALGGNGLSTLKQIHSPICLPVENACMNGVVEGDALVTKTAGHVIGCLTADCAPVLFAGADRDGAPVIGAAHAGWGGALKGVLESTIAAMVRLGADLSTIKAAIGPCIGQASYEVGADFMTPFVEEDKRSIAFFSSLPDLFGQSTLAMDHLNKSGDDDCKYFFNLPAYVDFRLRRAGVEQIVATGQDTYKDSKNYFSYRRTTHIGETDYGRQISAIMIKD